MIDLSQQLLGGLCWHSLLVGVALGVIWDVIRFCKMMLGVEYGNRKKDMVATSKKVILYVVTFVSDVVFWLFFALSAIVITYTVSGGVFRGVVYLCMLIGLCVYYFTVGKIVLRISAFISSVLKRAISFAIGVVMIPIRAIFSAFVKLYHLTIGKIIGKIKERREERRKRLQQKLATQNALALTDGSGEEEKTDVRISGYRKEARISFGYRSSGQRSN